MKRTVKTFIAIWVILMIAFNALFVAFLIQDLGDPLISNKAVNGITPPRTQPQKDLLLNCILFSVIKYVLVVGMLITQLVCFIKVYKVDSFQKRFYSISLKKASYVELFIAGIAACVFGFLTKFNATTAIGAKTYDFATPAIIAIAVSVVLAFIDIIVGVSTRSLIGDVEKIDEKSANKIRFTESLAADIDYLSTYAKSEATKAACASVYDAVRYADPTVDASVQAIESVVAIKFADLDYAVKADDGEKATEIAAEIVALMKNRGNKAKLAI